MQALSNKDYRFIQDLCSLTEDNLHSVMKNFLSKKYKEVEDTKDYLFAKGEIPIAVIAHMDTVFTQPPLDIYYDVKKGAIWSPEGLGADDRAGVFLIIKLLNCGLRPSVIFTHGEEIGGTGSTALVEKYSQCPIPDLRYIIQLDRRGTSDCVFYDCANYKFIDYISQFGFTENFGSFTDISIICPEWGVAGVNLSVGYENEHSIGEVLHIAPLMATLKKVTKMLSEEEDSIPFFEYIQDKNAQSWNYYMEPIENSRVICCSTCGKSFLEEEIFPVKTTDGSIRFYCPDCMVDNVGWCDLCDEPFELEDAIEKNICNNCHKILERSTKKEWKKVSMNSKNNSNQ